MRFSLLVVAILLTPIISVSWTQLGRLTSHNMERFELEIPLYDFLENPLYHTSTNSVYCLILNIDGYDRAVQVKVIAREEPSGDEDQTERYIFQNCMRWLLFTRTDRFFRPHGYTWNLICFQDSGGSVVSLKLHSDFMPQYLINARQQNPIRQLNPRSEPRSVSMNLQYRGRTPSAKYLRFLDDSLLLEEQKRPVHFLNLYESSDFIIISFVSPDAYHQLHESGGASYFKFKVYIEDILRCELKNEDIHSHRIRRKFAISKKLGLSREVAEIIEEYSADYECILDELSEKDDCCCQIL